MMFRNKYKKISIEEIQKDLSPTRIVTSTAEPKGNWYLPLILFSVLVTVLPFTLSAQHSIDLTTIFPKTKKDTLTFRDSSWCEMDAGTVCKYAGAGWRSLLVSGRALFHIAPGPTKFEINLYPHKLVVAPYETADIYLYSRNFRLISACLLSGNVTWVHKKRTIPLVKRAGIYLRGSDYLLDMSTHIYNEYKDWSRGLYHFDDITVPEFAEELSKKYEVHIDANDPALKDHRIHTAIDNSTSLFTMLNRLCQISHLNYMVTENNTMKLTARKSEN